MRLILVPLNKTSRLVYAQKTLLPKVRQTPRLDEKVLAKATKTWQGFEKSDTKWKKQLVAWSNIVLKRIPYAEWSLRTVPSINTYQRVVQKSGEYISPKKIEDHSLIEPVGFVYPQCLLSQGEAFQSVRDLASSGVAHHRKLGIWSCVAMPFTFPIALIPIVPNIPFFYLVFRAYCHWEAYNGAKHLLHLVDTHQLKSEKLPALEKTFDNWSGELNNTQQGRVSRIFCSSTLDHELARALEQIDKKKQASVSKQASIKEKDKQD